MTDDSSDAKDVLLTLHRENSEQARYYGQQRQTIANVVSVATAIVLGALLLAADNDLDGNGVLLLPGFFLLVLGGFGFAASLRHHERSRLHVQRVHAIRREISERFPVDIPALYKIANEEHVKRFARMSDRTARMHYLWQGLHAAVSVIGLAVLCVAC